MSKEQATSFLESVSGPSDLAEFKQAMNTSVEAIVRLGTRKGFDFDGPELRAAIAGLMENMPSPDELSEAELESAVGGTTRTLSSSSLNQLGLAIHAYHSYTTANYGDQYTTPFWGISP